MHWPEYARACCFFLASRLTTARLDTKDLSSGSSLCFVWLSLLTPCEFQRLAGKASARNWKMTIRHLDLPLSCFLESYTNADGKRCCQFMDCNGLVVVFFVIFFVTLSYSVCLWGPLLDSTLY